MVLPPLVGVINENLAQQAQAIYADIFITNADPAWPLGHLSDLITVRYGKDHKKLDDGPFPVYGSGGVMRYVERPIYEKESVLIPRKGTLNNVMYVNEPFWSVDTMFFTEMKLPDVAKFVFHLSASKALLVRCIEPCSITLRNPRNWLRYETLCFRG